MTIVLLWVLLLRFTSATPPFCFLGCINAIAHICPRQHDDIGCLCSHSQSVIDYITESCWGINYYSARDHFIGTCMEHQFDIGEIREHPHFEHVPFEEPFDEDDIEFVSDSDNEDTSEHTISNKEDDNEDNEDDLYEEEEEDLYESEDDNANENPENEEYQTEESEKEKKETSTAIPSISFEKTYFMDPDYHEFDDNRDYRLGIKEKFYHLSFSKLTELLQSSPGICYEIDNQDTGIRTQKCFQYILHQSNGLPKSSRYLERFHVPYGQYARPQDEDSSEESVGSFVSEESGSTITTYIDETGRLIQVTRKIKTKPLHANGKSF